MNKLSSKHFRYAGYFWIAVIFLTTFNWIFYMMLIHRDTEHLWENISYGFYGLALLLPNMLYFGVANSYDDLKAKPSFTPRVARNWLLIFLGLTVFMGWVSYYGMASLAGYYQTTF